MIEARIAFYCTCDFCGSLGRSEVPAIVQVLVWKNPEPQVRLPEGWRTDMQIGPGGRAEKHRCAECVAKQGAQIPKEAVEAAAGLAALSSPESRS